MTDREISPDFIAAYLSIHEGKAGQHWLGAAIQRLAAGDNEAEIMSDFGYVPLARVATLEKALNDALDVAKRYGKHSPLSYEGTCLLCDELRAIKEAAGVKPAQPAVPPSL